MTISDYFDTTKNGYKTVNYANASKALSDAGWNGYDSSSVGDSDMWGNEIAKGNAYQKFRDQAEQMNKNIDAYNRDKKTFSELYDKTHSDINMNDYAFNNNDNILDKIGKSWNLVNDTIGNKYDQLTRKMAGEGWNKDQYLNNLGYGKDSVPELYSDANNAYNNLNKINKDANNWSIEGLKSIPNTGNDTVDNILKGTIGFATYLPAKALQGVKGVSDATQAATNLATMGKLGYNNYDLSSKNTYKKDLGDMASDTLSLADAALTAYDIAGSAGGAAQILSNTKNGLGTAIKSAAPELAKQYGMDLGENLMENYIDTHNAGENADFNSYLDQIPFSAQQSLLGEVVGGATGRAINKTGLSDIIGTNKANKVLNIAQKEAQNPEDLANAYKQYGDIISGYQNKLANNAGKAATIGAMVKTMNDSGVGKYMFGGSLTGDDSTDEYINQMANEYGITPEQALYVLQYEKGQF